MASHGGGPSTQALNKAERMFQSPVWQAMAVDSAAATLRKLIAEFQSPVWQAMAVDHYIFIYKS